MPFASSARRVIELGADVVADQAVAVVGDQPVLADHDVDLDELELVLLAAPMPWTIT